MSNVATIEENNVPYLEITTNKQPYNDYFESLSRNLTLENCNANIIKNIWTWCILGHSGEQRNAMAWDFWNKVPQNIKNNTLKTIIWATTDDNSYETQKLDTELNILEKYPNYDGSKKGISQDISHKHLFSIDTNNAIINKFINKTNDNKQNIQVFNDNNSTKNLYHITYGNDNFLYVSGDNRKHGEVLKYDSISISEIQKNTELYVINCTYDYYNIDSSLLPDSPTFEDYFNSSYASNTTTGANWLYPCFSYRGSGSGYSFQFPDYAQFMDKPSFLSTDYYGLVIYGTFKVQNSSETFDVEIGHNGGVEFSVNSSIIGGLSNAGIENSGTEKQQLQINDGDTFTLRMQEKNDTDGLVFISKQKDRNERYNIPNFSTEQFQYMNYDSTGPWLWVQNNYGVFKWDPQRMLVREAQPINNTNQKQINSDIVVDENYIYFIDTNSYIYQLNKDLTVNNSNDLSSEIQDKIGTLHFDPNGYICFGYRDTNEEKPHFAKIRTNDLNIDSKANLDSLLNAPGDFQNHKITILPDDGSIIIAASENGSGKVYKMTNNLIYNFTNNSINAECTGLIYDIEKLS